MVFKLSLFNYIMVISGNFPVDINIGSLIESRMETMHISKAEFARRMQMPQSNASRILKKETMDTSKLQVICEKLDYNFFEEFCGREDGHSGEEGRRWPTVHIGSSIERQLKESKMTQSEFAHQLGVKQPEVSRLLKRADLDTGKLVVISNLLKYNFFEEFCVVKKATSAADLIEEIQSKMTPIQPIYQMQFTSEQYKKFLMQQLELPEEERIIKITVTPKDHNKK